MFRLYLPITTRLNKQLLIYGPASQSLKVLGQFVGELAYKQYSHNEQNYKGLRTNLLGLGAIKKLRLVKQMESNPHNLKMWKVNSQRYSKD